MKKQVNDYVSLYNEANEKLSMLREIKRDFDGIFKTLYTKLEDLMATSVGTTNELSGAFDEVLDEFSNEENSFIKVKLNKKKKKKKKK